MSRRRKNPRAETWRRVADFWRRVYRARRDSNIYCVKTLFLSLSLLVAVSVRAQLPTASPKAAGFDPSRLTVLHATTKRFVDEGKHAGLITLLARDGKIGGVIALKSC